MKREQPVLAGHVETGMVPENRKTDALTHIQEVVFCLDLFCFVLFWSLEQFTVDLFDILIHVLQVM